MYVLLFLRTARNHITTFKTQHEFYEAKLDLDFKTAHYLDHVLSIIRHPLRLVEFKDFDFVAGVWPEQLLGSADTITHLHTDIADDQVWFYHNVPSDTYLHFTTIPEALRGGGRDLKETLKATPESEVFKPDRQFH